MAQEYRAEKEDATILSMKLRLGESRIVVVEQEKETVSQLEKSLFEMMYGVEEELGDRNLSFDCLSEVLQFPANHKI